MQQSDSQAINQRNSMLLAGCAGSSFWWATCPVMRHWLLPSTTCPTCRYTCLNAAPVWRLPLLLHQELR